MFAAGKYQIAAQARSRALEAWNYKGTSEEEEERSHGRTLLRSLPRSLSNHDKQHGAPPPMHARDAGGIGNLLKAAELAPSSLPPLPIPWMQGIQLLILSLSLIPKSLRNHFC